MLKYLFTLALLVPIVFCRYAPEERSDQYVMHNGVNIWNNGTHYGNCSCGEECICDLSQTIKCKDTEKCCGKKPYEGHVYCPWDDICIPIDCECLPDPNPKHCERICDICKTCNPISQLCCGQDCDANGCPKNDFCHDKPYRKGKYCLGFCPFECDPSEYECPQLPDPDTDCPVCKLCIPRIKDIPGKYCNEQPCPVICDPIREVKCPGEVYANGCVGKETCIAKCSETCPVYCNPEQIKCIGITNCETNCKEIDECKARFKNTNNEYCPDASYSHDCPVRCCEGSIVCPPEIDPLGCKGKAVCTKRTNGTNGDYCPTHSDCPKICLLHQIVCNLTKLDDNGCKKEQVCVDQRRGYDNTLCTVHCPCECDEEDEICCHGQRNENGCLEPDQCMKRPIKLRGDCVGELCPGYCPALCSHGQVLCPSQTDPCDGCPTEEVCKEKVKDKNGISCKFGEGHDPFSASHNCHKLCDDIHGFTLCPARMLADGCKDEAKCVERSIGNDNNYCPSHSDCEVHCDGDWYLKCTCGSDVRGCKGKTLCVHRGTDNENKPCDGFCPPTCGKAETLEPQGQYTNGCQKPPLCVDYKNLVGQHYL